MIERSKFSVDCSTFKMLRPASVCLLFLAPLFAIAATNATGLRAALPAHLNQERFDAAMWGVKIVSLDSGRTLFEHNANKLLKPASNAKLFAAALALDRLGPDYRIKSSLHAAARPDKSGTLRGDLIVHGRGDPSFAERFDGGSYTDVLRPIVNAIAAAGNARAKTGTLRHVNTLSGYVTTKAGEDLAFSLMLNNYAGDDARGALDTIVVLLAELEQR